MSLSARRAWIEIRICALIASVDSVALRKESVDRNLRVANCILHAERSLSARRAWIEIDLCAKLCQQVQSRSPQGERG